MTKTFLHGRTEAIRTVQEESVHFVKVSLLLMSEGPLPLTFFRTDFLFGGDGGGKDHCASPRMQEARRPYEGMFEGTGPGPVRIGPCNSVLTILMRSVRHLYALYCLLQREFETSSDVSSSSSGSTALPEIFRDGGWMTLGTSILSTSNCGNPALRLFGFGPVSPDGYGIGYIIKDDGLSVCASSKHLQTRRFLDTLQGYLDEVQRVLVALTRAANEHPEPFVDHAGVLRDSKTGRRINGTLSDEEEEDDSIRASSLFLWLAR